MMTLDTLSSAAAAWVQWWSWIAMLAVVLFIGLRLSRGHFAARDRLLRAFVVLSLALLGVSFAVTALREPPIRTAALAWPSAPAPDASGAPRTSSVPVSPESTSATPPEPATDRMADNVNASGDPHRDYTPTEHVALVPAATGGQSWPSVSIAIPDAVTTPLLALHAIGVLFGLILLRRDLAGVTRLYRRGAVVRDARVLDAVDRGRHRLGIARPVPVHTADAYPAALLVGPLRPCVLLATPLIDRLDDARLEQLIAHELAHCARRDLVWQLLHRIVAILAWPLPMHRPIARSMRRVSEVLCDRLVVDTGSSASSAEPNARHSYAEALVDAVRHGARLAPQPSSAAAESESFLRRRIEMVLTPRSDRLAPLRLAAFVVSAALLAAVLPALRVESQERPPIPAAAVRADADDTGGAPPAKPSSPRELPEAIVRAKRDFAERMIAQAAIDYATNEDREAYRVPLRMAHSFGGLGREVVPLGDTMGVLALQAIDARFDAPEPVPGQRSYPPFLLQAIEARFGKLDRSLPDVWISPQSGLIVHERATLDRIAAEFFPIDERARTIVTSIELWEVDEAGAQDCFEQLGIDEPGSALDAAVSPEAERALEERRKDLAGAIQVIASPIFVTLGGQVATIEISSQRAYIEKYKIYGKGETAVTDAVAATLKEGLWVDVLAFVEKSGKVRLYLRTDVTHLDGIDLRVSLPNAHQVPLHVPKIERDEAFHATLLEPGKPRLLGQVPDPKLKVAYNLYPKIWVVVRADLPEIEEADD